MSDHTPDYDALPRLAIKATAAVACIFIVSVSGCTIHQNQYGYSAVERLVAAGSSPIAAGCAVWGFGDHTTTLLCDRTSRNER